MATEKCRWIRQFDNHFAISCPSGERGNAHFKGKDKGAKWEFIYCPYCGREIEEYFDDVPTEIECCPECSSTNIRIDNRDRPDYRLDGYCFDCLHEWSCEQPTASDAKGGV